MTWRRSPSPGFFSECAGALDADAFLCGPGLEDGQGGVVYVDEFACHGLIVIDIFIAVRVRNIIIAVKLGVGHLHTAPYTTDVCGKVGAIYCCGRAG